MTKKRRIYQIGIALLLCFMQTAGIAMYGQNRPRAAAKRIHRLQADSLNAIRQAARIPSDSLGLTMDEPVLHQAVTLNTGNCLYSTAVSPDAPMH